MDKKNQDPEETSWICNTATDIFREKNGDVTKVFSQTWPAYWKQFRANNVLLSATAGILQTKNERIGSTGKGNRS
jgi:hypothetical protein